MKPYEKPRLIAMSLSGNNKLCDSCEIDIIGDNADPTYKETVGDFFDSPFSSGDSCEQQVEVGGYCKFTATTIVINS